MTACTSQSPASRAASVPDALRWLPVLDSAVVIAAPPGYCIDIPASRSERQDAFVLLASCQSVTGDTDAPVPAAAGLLTASVDGAGTGTMPPQQDLDTFFASPIGRSALSRKGDPDAVDIGERRFRDGAYMLHVRERTDDPVMGSQSWRAVFEVNERLVTATLREMVESPISVGEGFRTIERFARDIRRASPQ